MYVSWDESKNILEESKLKQLLLRVNAYSVWKNVSVVNANAKILGQSDNWSYVHDNKCNSEYKR